MFLYLQVVANNAKTNHPKKHMHLIVSGSVCVSAG